MRIALFYSASCYSAHALQGHRDGTLRLFWEMDSCSPAFYAVLARGFTQCVFEETTDDSFESFYDWFCYCTLAEISVLHAHLE